MRISTEIHPIWERLGTSWLFRFHCKQTFCECSQMEMNTMQSGNVNCIRRGRGWGWDLTLCSKNPLRSPRLAPTVGKHAEGDTMTSGSHKLWSAFWLSKWWWDRFRPNDEDVKIPHPLCWLFFDPINSFLCENILSQDVRWLFLSLFFQVPFYGLLLDDLFLG